MRKLWVTAIMLGGASGVLLTASGCKKGASINDQAFQNAKPEAKAAWDTAMAARKTNGYAVAIMQLKTLREQPGLSAEQASTVDAAMKKVNDDMYDAANRDDPAGKQGLEDLRKMTGR